MRPGEAEHRIRLLEQWQIVVVGAECERCGARENLTTFLNRHDGDRFTSLCMNSVLCAERQAEKVTEA